MESSDRTDRHARRANGLTVTKLTDRCSRLRRDPTSDPEMFGTKTAMQALAARVRFLSDQSIEL